MKGYKDSKNKFHPIKPYTKVRKKKEPFQVKKTEGVPMEKLVQMQRADVGRRKRYAHQQMQMPIDMSVSEQMEWEQVVGSEIVKVKKEMMNGRPVTSVRFANGEEWFEFDEINHQEEYLEKENIKVDDTVIGEFVEIDHPDIAGYITMETGKVLFGEKEDRMKRTQLKTVFPYKGRIELAKLKFKDLPDELQDDLSDLAEPSGVMTLLHPERDWNEMTEKEKLEFIEGIRDPFGS